MRILLVVPAMAELYGGPTKIARELAGALGKLGLEVDVVATDASGPDRASVSTSYWIIERWFRLRYVRRFGGSEFKFSFQLIFWLWKNVRNYDVVHIQSDFNFPVLAAAVISRIRGISYMVNPQGMLEPWALNYKKGKKRAYYKLVERPLVLRSASAIQALTAIEASNIEALKLARKVVVIPNGIDLEEAEARAGDVGEFLSAYPEVKGKRLLLFLHRIDPKKGLDILAQSFGEVARQFPRIHLVVAGPDLIDYWKQISNLFRRKGCERNLTYTGMITGSKKRGALAACEVFLAPSRSEGFSMSILEAMAAGRPCLITDGCNFPEAGEAGVARITRVDANEFTNALRELLANPNEASMMGARGRNFVLEKYSWSQVAVHLKLTFEGLTADSQRKRVQ